MRPKEHLQCSDKSIARVGCLYVYVYVVLDVWSWMRFDSPNRWQRVFKWQGDKVATLRSDRWIFNKPSKRRIVWGWTVDCAQPKVSKLYLPTHQRMQLIINKVERERERISRTSFKKAQKRVRLNGLFTFHRVKVNTFSWVLYSQSQLCQWSTIGRIEYNIQTIRPKRQSEPTINCIYCYIDERDREERERERVSDE